MKHYFVHNVLLYCNKYLFIPTLYGNLKFHNYSIYTIPNTACSESFTESHPILRKDKFTELARLLEPGRQASIRKYSNGEVRVVFGNLPPPWSPETFTLHDGVSPHLANTAKLSREDKEDQETVSQDVRAEGTSRSSE